MKKTSIPGVIVLGGHIQGLGIIRIFGEAGIPAILLDESAFNIARSSKYCLDFVRYRNDNLIELLSNLAKEGKYSNWLLIPTKDYHVKILSQNRDNLSKQFQVSTGTWSSVDTCYNKINTYRIAEQLGIKIPYTEFPDSAENLKSSEIKFPCIIKPAIMHEFYQKTKKKVFVCRDQEELTRNYARALQIIPHDQIIVQEIITGTSENLYSACFLFIKGKAISKLTARRKRQHPIDFGNATTFAETVNIPQLIEESTKFLSHIDYNGICEVEYKKDPVDGEYKLLEINPRSWKWHLISRKMGVHFLINLYNYHYGIPFKTDAIIPTNLCWRHVLTDIPICLILALRRQLVKSDCKEIQYAVWNRKDLLPGIFEFFLLPVLIFKRS